MAENFPAAPDHLPENIQKKWTAAYAAAMKQAKTDFPDDEPRQRASATKEANRMLAVPAPESAKDIEKLEGWQVLVRGTRKSKDGGEEMYVVTADGRKYSFPVAAKKAKEEKPSDPPPAA